MSKYSPTAAQDLLAHDEDNIALTDELQSGIAKAFDAICKDSNLAVFALADDLLPPLLEKLAGMDLNDYAIEPVEDTAPAAESHTPQDSLTFLNQEAVGLLEAADEEIHGVYTDTILETEDLPGHIQDAVAMIHTASKLIRMEAGLHGARNRATYSTGSPTSEVRQEPGHEPQDDGTSRLVVHDVHFGLYPDGHHNHPAFR